MKNIAVVIGTVFAISCGSPSGTGDAASGEAGYIKPVPGTVSNPNRGIDADEFDSQLTPLDGGSGQPALDAGAVAPLCPAPVSCGGNLVGTWDITGGCAAILNSEGCDRYYALTATGTITFRSDGAFALNIPSYSVVYKMADACVKAQGRVCTGSQCAQGNDGYCACSLFSNLADSTGGSYSTSGAALTLAAAAVALDGGGTSFVTDAQSFNYCVNGDALTIVAQPTSSTTGVGQTTIGFAKIH